MFNTFLLGKHEWTFSGDTCFQDGSKHIISFSVCEPGDKDGVGWDFACENGICIPTDQRCDGISNCRDSSDEKNCKKVKIGDEYSSANVPFIVENKEIIKNKVNVSIALTQIVKISELDSIFALKFELSVDWIDNRLSYLSLSVDQEANSLKEDEKLNIWVPQLTFFNTRGNEQTVNDQVTMIQIRRQGDMTLVQKNEFSFDGSQNSLTMQRKYVVDFECDYYMAWYPFDLQKCTIVIGLRSRDVNYMEILPTILKYTETKGSVPVLC